MSVPAPAGTDTFLVSAYSGPSGTGSLLSRATVQATIAGNGTSIVPVVLNGNVASIALTLANVNPSLHQTTTDALTVIAKDATGNTIVGPGGYLSPITLTDSDTSGHSALTTTTLNGPGDTVALQYDGGYGAGSITASALGVSTTSSATFVPRITSSETALPASRTARDLIVGPDGALWFIDSPFMIGRITTAGVLSEFAAPPNWSPSSICSGPDGAIWFTADGAQFASGAIIRRAPDGTYNVYQVATAVSAGACESGPDGNLYAAFGGLGLGIVQITPSGTMTLLTLQDAHGTLHAGSPITGSPDGGLWFVDTGYDALDRYDLTTHALTIRPVRVPLPPSGGTIPLAPAGVVVGPDKRFYFDGSFSIYASDTAGAISTVYPETNGVGAEALGFAADGALWFSTGNTQAGFPTFARMSGSVPTPLLGTSAQSGFPTIDSLVAAPDGSLWYSRGNAVGKIVP